MLQTKHVGESPTCAHHRVWRSPNSPLSRKPTPRFRAWLIHRCLLEHLILSYEFTSIVLKGEKYEDRTKCVHKIFGICLVSPTDSRRTYRSRNGFRRGG